MPIKNTQLQYSNLKSKKLDHKITSTFNTTYNGVAMKLPANQVEMLLKSEVVKSVYKNVEFKVDPIALGEEKASNNNAGNCELLIIFCCEFLTRILIYPSIN
ncbi:protease inhibitor I9 family protein [Neobacillus sp. WH10]|uniref:protease inhibitor I9 family protein n=1 Tax=Neobacillus sp. WH10 TaxID=3047873 RepID=UPI0024C1D96D|nr:protease inhibitor I9 family protein [Neobacillus sp. WH10]WHY77072.1 protease inhibitor I9 family protein [Neobacillus sp. WH10]